MIWLALLNAFLCGANVVLALANVAMDRPGWTVTHTVCGLVNGAVAITVILP